MKIPAGTTYYIEPPAKLIPKQISDAIGTALGKIPEIVEAHLPMVYIKGQIEPPAQVLVVVLEENRRLFNTARRTEYDQNSINLRMRFDFTVGSSVCASCDELACLRLDIGTFRADGSQRDCHAAAKRRRPSRAWTLLRSSFRTSPYS